MLSYTDASRLIRAAGLRWPAEEGSESGKDCFVRHQRTRLARNAQPALAG
jgi:hypothetical protein